MVIYYDSKTGNVARFIEKVRALSGWTCAKITETTEAMQEGHLVTFTTKIGCVPSITEAFMENNASKILSVSSSGNMNWGPNFALAADKLSEQYAIPVLLKFELAGLQQNVIEFIKRAEQYADKKMDTPQQ